MAKVDLVNKKFGRLLILAPAPAVKGKSSWYALCDCGTTRMVTDNAIKNKRGPRSCGCLQKDHASALGKHNCIAPGSAAFNMLYGTYFKSARQRGLDFKLTRAQFREITSANCHYCGKKPSQSALRGKKHKLNGDYTFNGVDRKDNNRGYTLDNSAPCCSICNYGKRGLSYQEFINYITNMVNYHVNTLPIAS